MAATPLADLAELLSRVNRPANGWNWRACWPSF